MLGVGCRRYVCCQVVCLVYVVLIPSHTQPSSSYMKQSTVQPTPLSLFFSPLKSTTGAGKTSILRRYFLRSFEEHSRVATLGSDFYIGRVSVPNTDNNDDSNHNNNNSTMVNLQMWDTPGRERFYHHPKRKRRYTASLSDRFFRQADAVMLVYDMTSSTSFTQLLRYVYICVCVSPCASGECENKELVLGFHEICTHSAMYDIIRPLILPLLLVVVVWYACGIQNINNNNHNIIRWYADVLEIRKQNWFPVLIVGNKRDLFVANLQRATTLVHHSRRVPQRNVMGLKSFCGQDFRYEYKVDPGNHAFRSNHNHNHNNTTPTTTTTSTHTDTTARSTTENSFFLANRENWTTDNSYLDSLLNSEDASHPSVGASVICGTVLCKLVVGQILTLRIVLFLCVSLWLNAAVWTQQIWYCFGACAMAFNIWK